VRGGDRRSLALSREGDYTVRRPIPPLHPGQWTVVGIALGVGAGEGASPLPAQAGPGHDRTDQGSLPIANPGRSSWKI